MRRQAAILACLAAMVTGGTAAGQDGWTRFRGPDGTGVSEAASIPVTFDQDDFCWETELPGRGHSSPVLWDGKVFLTSEIREEHRRFVVCVDAADGQIAWSWGTSYEPYRSHGYNSFAASTPAVDGSGVYVSWVSGTKFIVLALDHAGNLVWERSMDDFQSRFGAGASPIVIDGVVVMGNDHAGQTSFLIGLDARTGQTRWKVSRASGLTSYVTPAVYRSEEGAPEVIFSSPSHGLTGLDPRTGEVRWELGELFTQKTVSSPVVAGELIVATSGKGGRGVESAAVRRGDRAAGRQPELVYSIRSDLPYVPTPVAYRGYLFIWSDSGVVTCVDSATGERWWRERVGGEYFSSPICVGGRLYGVSKKGEVVVVDAAPRFRIAGRSQLPEGSYATPAVAGDRIYFRTFSRLICVGGDP